VVSSAPDAIVTLDAECRIQLANAAAAAEFGYEVHELVGQRIDMLLQDNGSWDALWNSAINGETVPRAVEVMAKRKDGTVSYLEVSASRWMSSSQRFVTTVFRNVDERRAAEDALRSLNQTLEQRVEERTAKLLEAEDRLRQAQKMEAIGQLTGGMAHDFNNLLAVILGNAEVLVEDELTPAMVQAHSQQILTAAEKGADLNQKLLAFGRRQSLKPEAIDVAQVVKGLAMLLQRTLGEQIDLEVIVHQGRYSALSDRTLLESALLNLAVNARDAMQSGGTPHDCDRRGRRRAGGRRSDERAAGGVCDCQ
jgi:PAS domain S-box-containing protein